ncbi:HNH endonuclease [Mycobacteroides abscessus]|uniref:HNH endonuclease n=1 Tax=Mycobacteroides abscessus TaxID=36809 RepID=UPI0009A8D32B
MQRPCIGCGCLIPSGSRCADCQPKREHRATAAAATDWRWRQLSKRVRKQSPFCEHCGQRDPAKLTAGHIVPVSVKPEWAHNIENVRTECRPCNSARGTKYTTAEYDMVEARIRARRQRALRYYQSQA